MSSVVHIVYAVLVGTGGIFLFLCVMGAMAYVGFSLKDRAALRRHERLERTTALSHGVVLSVLQNSLLVADHFPQMEIVVRLKDGREITLHQELELMEIPEIGDEVDLLIDQENQTKSMIV